MLQLILGRSGTGKTTELYSRLCRAVEDGRPAILLVPEQFSFAGERELTRRLGLGRMRQVQVLSFTRLADWIFRQMGGMAGRTLDQATRLILMSVALDQLKDTLSTYRRQKENPAFIPALVELAAEFKNAGASPQDLERAARTAGDEPLRAKLEEIAALYGAYQALVDRGFADPLDDESRAARLAAEEPLFGQTEIFVDGFISFTAAEESLLAVLLAQSPALTAALTADGLSDEGGCELFATPRQTARRLVSLARRAAVPVAKPLVLTGGKRFRSAGIAALEAALAGEETAPAQEGVELVHCRNPYDEVTYAALSIARLVREEGYRYREIAVVTRQLDRYRPAVGSVFGRCGIPFFSDQRAPVTAQPLLRLVEDGLEAVRSRWDSQALLRLSKNPALGLEEEGAARLENYCYTWSPAGGEWRSPFARNPAGFGEMTDQQRLELEQINQVRARLVEPVARLERELEDCDGQGFALGVFHFLENTQAAEHLRQFAAGLPPQEERDQLELCSGLWEGIVSLLDTFAVQLEGVRYPLARFAQLFSMGAASIDVGQLPRTVDQVLFADASRVRMDSPRAVFVLGVSEGEFPLPIRDGGLFCDSERDLLIQAGIRLASTGLRRALEERYHLYTALSAPRERLVVTSPRGDAKGSRRQPSLMVERAARKAGIGWKEGTVEPLDRVVNLDTALDEAAAAQLEASPWGASLEEELLRRGQEGLERLRQAAQGMEAPSLAAATARSLYGDRITTSASRLEGFYRCPFQYFCRYTLQVEPRKKAEFSFLESGSLAHEVLEELMQAFSPQELCTLSQEELRREIIVRINRFLEERVGEKDGLPPRTRYQFLRLVNVLVRLLRRLGEELSQSRFVPAGFEVEVGEQGQAAPYRVESPGGVQVAVEGRIDRVDLMDLPPSPQHPQGQRMARVVDYKTGGKKLDLGQVLAGLEMQMFLYLFALCQGGRGPYQGVSPAGVLYMPASAEAATVSRTDPPQKVAKDAEAAFRMDGLLLSDREVLTGMERELAGRYIPVTLGGRAAPPLADQEAFARLDRRIRRLVGEMADRLEAGEIARRPAKVGDSLPCDRCDYRLVCESCGQVEERPIPRMTVPQALDQLEKWEGEDEDGGRLDAGTTQHH